jgi:hypothetical protein
VTTRPARPARQTPTSPARFLLALVIGLALFAGIALPHGNAAEHRDSPVGADVDRSARHPGDPTHFEASTVEFEPGCPLCVLQLQSASLLPVPEPSLPVLTAHGTALPPAPSVTAAPVVRTGPARAPPVLSSPR